MLSIDKLPPGDYSLLLKDSGRQIRIRLTEGDRREGYVLGDYRKLETRERPAAANASQVEVTDDRDPRRSWKTPSPLARVHVFGTRFEPAFSAYGSWRASRGPSRMRCSRRGPNRNTSPAAISATNIATSSIASSPASIPATCSNGRACC